MFVVSDSVATGYTDDDDDNASIDGGFLTGDLGFVDSQGQLTLTGRASAAVNVAGRKVHPGEVERVLRDPGSAWVLFKLDGGLDNRRVKLGKLAQPLRAALTGRTTSPGIFDVLALLGQGESLARIADQMVEPNE